MGVFKIKKGRNIRLKGAAHKELVDKTGARKAAVQPPDFRGLKPRLAVAEGDRVKVGAPLIVDKEVEGLKLLSPLCGKVTAINRGAKRALLEVVVEADGTQEAESLSFFSPQEIEGATKESITTALLAGGLWPAIRQRPFHKIANPKETPKSIFVRGLNTEPLAPDLDYILKDQEKDFQTGLDILKKLTKGPVHVCAGRQATSKALTASQGVEVHRFSGPHPAGNIGTQIHYVDPILKGDIVWFVEAQDVIRIAQLLTTGKYPTSTIVALTGEGVKNPTYAKTVVGAALSELLGESDLTGQRCITGGCLAGRAVGAQGFVGFYDSQVTVIPEGGKREFLGWLAPGFNKFTFSHTYASSFLGERDVSLDTDEHGGHRAIVLNNVYDRYNALDLCTFFLLRAVIAEDYDEAERLGILECDEEDFALCTFACPSKTDIGGIIRKGLDVIEKEG